MSSDIEDVNAQLRRSNVRQGMKVDHELSELIGEGTLKKMVRAALTDPDDELWRYSIAARGHVYAGEDIRKLARPSEQKSLSRAPGEGSGCISRL